MNTTKRSKLKRFKNLLFSKFICVQQRNNERRTFYTSQLQIHVKLKDQSPNELFKKTLESSYSILESDRKVKTLAPSDIENFSGQSGYIKNLSKKVKLKSLTHAYENFFLYDLENIIKLTFAAEVQKEFSIYGLISFSGETKKK